MPLIPTDLLTTYAIFNFIVSAMVWSVIGMDHKARRMSQSHCAFFSCIASGLFLEGMFVLSGTQDESLYQLAFFMRVAGIWALGISIFMRTLVDKFHQQKRKAHA
jgi:hypothetical protein